jgi:hypothetical protein
MKGLSIAFLVVLAACGTDFEPAAADDDAGTPPPPQVDGGPPTPRSS